MNVRGRTLFGCDVMFKGVLSDASIGPDWRRPASRHRRARTIGRPAPQFAKTSAFASRAPIDEHTKLGFYFGVFPYEAAIPTKGDDICGLELRETVLAEIE